MKIAFLVTTPYQIYHYKEIAKHFSFPVTVIVEERDRDFGLSDSFIRQHISDCRIETIFQQNLKKLDGRYDAIICQTPILPNMYLDKTLVIAQQYSMAKESYQYGVWRTNANLNLMYGQYSYDQVEPFCNAAVVGNPMLDPYFELNSADQVAKTGKNLLYMPTYGELSSIDKTYKYLVNCGFEVIIKLHHAESSDVIDNEAVNIRLVYSDADPVKLFQWADCVISDYSGAAYDAFFVGKPLILVNAKISMSSKELKRLSDNDREHKLLNDYAAVWKPGESLDQAFTEAKSRNQKSTEAQHLREKLLVNPGSAGEACAEAIVNIIEQGEPYSFVKAQIRDTLTTYQKQNKSLIEVQKRVKRSQKSFYIRLRTRLSNIQLLNNIYHSLKAKLNKESGLESDKNALELTADDNHLVLRNRIGELLSHCLDLHDIEYQQCQLPDIHRSLFAVRETDRVKLFQALQSMAKDNPEIMARMKNAAYRRKIKHLKDFGIEAAYLNAISIDLAFSAQLNNLRIIWDSAVTIYFVEEAEGFILAEDSRAEKVDWTSEFAHDSSIAEQAFPAESFSAGLVGDVDFVYTWVDSGDINWQKKRALYSNNDNEEQLVSSDNEERFLNRNELLYSLRSIHLYAPFVRRIFIVTDDQKPDWLHELDDRIRIISHKEIFPDQQMLPAFNSHAIEACLHRIPGLAEHFVYFNDDVFLGGLLNKYDFFTRAGQPKIRLSPSQFILETKPNKDSIPTDWAAYNANRLIFEKFDIAFNRKTKHVPHPLRKSILEEIENKFPSEFALTRNSRFRSQTDIAIPSMFFPFYCLATGLGVEEPNTPYDYIYVDTGKIAAHNRLRNILRKEPKFFCLNSTRFREIAIDDQYELILEFLENRFPLKSPYEI